MENIKHKILLIEDDRIDERAFLEMVEKRRLLYDCRVARSVSEARAALNLEQFDVVIADYLLEDGTAFDILESVGDTPVIIVTGVGDEEIAIKAWKAGAYDYLIKDQERNYLKAVAVTISNAIEHKKAREKVKLLSHVITRNDDSVYITDMNDKIIFINRAFCEKYGYEESEVIGKNCDILWKGNFSSEPSEDNCRTVSGWETGFYHRRKDGSEFPVSLYRSVIRDEKGDEIALLRVARDISEHIFLEEQLRTINVQLKN